MGSVGFRTKGKRSFERDTSIIGYSCYMLGQLYPEQKGLTMRLPKNSLGINDIDNMDTLLFLCYNYWIRKIW